MDERRVTVTLDEAHLGGTQEVAEELQRRGLEVESVLESVGMITGKASDPAALREVDGVASVDEDLEYQIPAPDEEIQ